MGEDWRSWKGNTRPSRPGLSSVPSWEKTFCTSICSIPWGKICAAKSSLSANKNITEWDDSGALEAFNNAKSRYWAEINNLPHDFPLPDPNIYIDKIDHNAVVDPKLVLDLYKKPPPPPPDTNKNGELSFEQLLNSNTPIQPTGWGDASEHDSKHDDGLLGKPLPTNKWGSGENSSNLWNENGEIVSNRAFGGYNSWDKQKKYDSWGRHMNNWNYEQGRSRNGMKRSGFGSRFPKPRQTNTAHWKPKAPFGPPNGQNSAEGAWTWKNSVT